MPIIAPPSVPIWIPPPIGFFADPASLEAISRGIGSIVEYNGLVMNDRRLADRYVITDMIGIYDADVRDNRVVIPSQDGEIAFDSFYGGRPITITGKIRAGKYSQFKQMQQDMTTAFGTLEESPLKFRWWDVFDDFSVSTLNGDASPLGYYLWTGSYPIIQNGVLYPGSLPTIITHQLRSYCDSRVTMKVIVASGSTNAAAVGPVMKYSQGGTAYVQVQAKNVSGSISLVVSRYDAARGGLVLVDTSPASYPITQGMQFWVRSTMVDDNLVAEMWTVDPYSAPIGSSPFTLVSHQLSSGDADAFGTLVTGQNGITSQQPTSGAWYVDDFRIESIWPGDVVIPCKKTAAISIKEGSPTKLTTFEADFQVTLKASNPRFTAPFSLVQVVPPNAGVNYGRTYPTVYPYSYVVPVGPQGQILPPYISPNTAITNKGKWTAQPVIRLYGQMQAPTVTNETNGNQISLHGVIANGDYVDIDIAGGTMVNSAGADMFSMLVPSSDWPFLLEPGDNYLTCSSALISGAANCLVAWRHSSL